jgi:multiple sugar transport system permease protein
MVTITSATGAVPPTPSPGARRRRRRERLTILAFLSPWLIGFSVFLAYPLIATVYFSFTRYNLLQPPQWVGLRNYDFLLHKDPTVWLAFRNTVWLVAVIVPTRALFAYGVSAILIRIRHGAGYFRTDFYLPSLAPPVAATIAFVFLFTPGTGPVNRVLDWFGIEGPLWFSDPSWAKPGLAILMLWGIGDLMIIFLASMLDLPAEQYEAASIDGAGTWHKFRHITLPAMAPVILFAVVTGVIQTLQFFTQAVVAGGVAAHTPYVTGSSNVIGYPANSTMTLPMWLYNVGFHTLAMGYASAIAVFMFLIAMVFTGMLLMRSRFFYAEQAAS